MNQLPGDSIDEIASYCDSLKTLYLFRGVCKHVYDTSERTGGRYYSSFHIEYFDAKESYEMLFDCLSSADDDRIPNHLVAVLSAVVNGSTMRMEQMGLYESKFIVELFFELLVKKRGKPDIKSLLLSLLEQKSHLWNMFDQHGTLYPRRTILKMFQQLDEQSVLDLFKDWEEAGMEFLPIRFSFGRDYSDCEFDFIPSVSTGFTIFHLASWKNWKTILTQCWGSEDTEILTFDFLNRTPLHYAATLSNSDLAIWLLDELEADPFISDSLGVTPIALAYHYQNEPLLTKLKGSFTPDEVEEHRPLQGETEFDDLIHKEAKSMQRLQIEYKEGLCDSESEYWGYFLPQLREGLAFSSTGEIGYVSEEGSEGADSGHLQEDGISSEFALNNKIEDVEEAIRLFEQTTSTMKADGDYSEFFKQSITRVVSRHPLLDYVHERKEEVNENGKRERPADISEDLFVKRKKLTSEAVVHRMGEDYELSIPKPRFNSFLTEASQGLDFFTQQYTPLARFMIQDYAEALVIQVFKLADKIAAFYRSDFVGQQHYLAARNMITGRPGSAENTLFVMVEEDEEVDPDYTTESDISSDNCSDIIGLAEMEDGLVQQYYEVVYHGPNSKPLEVNFEWSPYSMEVEIPPNEQLSARYWDMKLNGRLD